MSDAYFFKKLKQQKMLDFLTIIVKMPGWVESPNDSKLINQLDFRVLPHPIVFLLFMINMTKRGLLCSLGP